MAFALDYTNSGKAFYSLHSCSGMEPSLATFWNTVAWTLSCEMAFYALFPLAHPSSVASQAIPRSVAHCMLWILDLAPVVFYLSGST